MNLRWVWFWWTLFLLFDYICGCFFIAFVWMVLLVGLHTWFTYDLTFCWLCGVVVWCYKLSWFCCVGVLDVIVFISGWIWFVLIIFVGLIILEFVFCLFIVYLLFLLCGFDAVVYVVSFTTLYFVDGGFVVGLDL